MNELRPYLCQALLSAALPLAAQAPSPDLPPAVAAPFLYVSGQDASLRSA